MRLQHHASARMMCLIFVVLAAGAGHAADEWYLPIKKRDAGINSFHIKGMRGHKDVSKADSAELIRIVQSVRNAPAPQASAALKAYMDAHMKGDDEIRLLEVHASGPVLRFVNSDSRGMQWLQHDDGRTYLSYTRGNTQVDLYASRPRPHFFAFTLDDLEITLNPLWSAGFSIIESKSPTLVFEVNRELKARTTVVYGPDQGVDYVKLEWDQRLIFEKWFLSREKHQGIPIPSVMVRCDPKEEMDSIEIIFIHSIRINPQLPPEVLKCPPIPQDVDVIDHRSKAS